MGARSALRSWLAVVLVALGVQVSVAAETAGKAAPEAAVAREDSSETFWPGSHEVQGMISLAYAHASDSAGPDTRGLRAGYGFFGRPAKGYPWGEYWVAYRRNGDFNITAAGLCVTHVSLTSRRLGLGTLVDLGISRRRSGDRTVYAAMGGVGAEGVFRISRWWDGVLSVEAVYRTTGDSELHGRVGIRFHHDRLPAPHSGP